MHLDLVPPLLHLSLIPVWGVFCQGEGWRVGEGWLEFRPEFGHLAILTLFMQVVPLPHLQPVIKTCLMSSLSPPPSMSWTKNTPVIISGTVFVGGLVMEVGEEQLEEIFSMVGKVEKDEELMHSVIITQL